MGKSFCIVLSVSLSFLLIAGTGCEDSNRFALGGKVGTLGVGGELTANIVPSVDARVGYNALDVDFNKQEFEDIEYNTGLDFSSLSVLADWHVFDGGFRVSGGFISMDNELRMDARPKTSVEIGDHIYTPSEIGTLTGKVEFDKIAPYIGIGWGNPFITHSRLGIATDFGIAFTNSPDVYLSATGMAAGLQSNLDIERRKMKDDVDSIKIYPIISFSIYYRF